MAGAASVLSDSSRLSRIDRSLYRIERILALLSGLAVFGLMFLAVFSVGGRMRVLISKKKQKKMNFVS